MSEKMVAMKQAAISTIATYEDDLGFRVDIVHNTEDEHPCYEAYLYHKHNCIKEFMFGYMDTDVTLEFFTELVFNNLPEYSQYYCEDYMSSENN